MSGSPELAINEARYQWCVRAFSLVRHRLGINIKVHGHNSQIESGQIFLFNHFARFETVIPQYFIYQATSAFCRCVATHELFDANEGFAKFLWSVGAVPNTHPGLLPFLAAEILRGRKIIFFPEGGMIKDRQVVDDNGQFNIFSPSALIGRKHHQGPAATALTLELFKKRILSVHAAGDTARLRRWVDALGLDGIDALIAAARQPTLIVPANITFFPIHAGDNILRKGAEIFGHDLGERAQEELLVEGNLLLKRTDMDIRFGNPIHPDIPWTLLERVMLKRMFEQIDSLPELFAMKTTDARWVDRMLATAMRRETQRLRDVGMREMYDHVTVNLNHLASRLILKLLDQGMTEIERGRFHRLLYAAFKNVQQETTVHLHRSLLDPEVYDGIHDGTSNLIKEFVATASASGLIEDAEPDRYRFLPKLRQNGRTRDPRLENVVLVYANEIAPVGPACRAVDQAIQAGLAAAPVALDASWLARSLYDDEVRAYTWSAERYSGPRYAAINDKETATESGRPFLLVPDKAKDLGIVLVHGFLASPAEVKTFGERLASLGYRVVGVRLKGHGTSPWDLRDRSWQDWLGSVRRGYEIMSLLAPRVCLIGFSTGGSLALHLAAEKPPGLAGVAAISSPVKFRNRNLVFVPFIHGLNTLTKWISSLEGLMPFRANQSEHPQINYLNMPIRGLFELRRVADELERRLPQVTCPVTILQSTDDHVVDPESAALILAKLGSAQKSRHMIASPRHGILYENVGETQDLILSFLDSLAPAPAQVAVKVSGKAVLPAPVADDALPATSPRSSGGGVVARLWHRLRSWVAASLAAPPAAVFDAVRPHPWEKSYPKGVDWNAAIAPKPLTALLDDAVKAYAEKTCVTFRGKHYRYREIGDLIDHAAKGFQALGVVRGTRVGLMLPNCPYAVICFYAVLKAGGMVVNINPLYSESEIEKQIADSSLRLLVTLDVKGLYDKVAARVGDGGLVDKIVVCRISGALRFTEKLLFGLFKGHEVASIPDDDRHVLFERLIDNDGAFAPVAIDPATDVAVLQYTGGTSGFPKAAQLTHANLSANAAQIAMWAVGVKRGQEKSLAVLPLFHAFGMTGVMNLSLQIGAELILLAKFQTAEVLETIDREKPTIFMGVPTMYSALLAAPDLGKYDLASLKFCISGGAGLPGEIQRRFEALSGCRLVEGYGLSETSPVCAVNPLTGGGKPGSVGLPLPGTVIEIVSLDDPDRLLGTGERGEICVTGPQVMAGYANRPKDNLNALRGGRFHTGDVGYLDEDGYLFVVDRIKDLIKSGGFNVYPRLVEEAIHLHPAVEETAVCGVPDQHRGEIVKAFVKRRVGASLTDAELRDFLKDKLAPFEMPRQIEFRDTLPKTLIGKISKKDLIAEAASIKSEPDPAPT
ncbi:MAG TPA: alpha/beta fold hydrolase [Alphaproteobacteria bacterium]